MISVKKRDNRPSPPLLDIVLFGLLLSGFSSVFKTCLLRKGFHTLKNNAPFSSPIDVGISQSTPFRVHRPRWHSFPSPIDVGLPNPLFRGPTSLLADCLVSTPFGATSSLALCPVSGSYTICNSPSPPHIYCPLWAFSFELPLKVSKTRLLGGGFHTLIKNVLFSFPTELASHTSSHPKVAFLYIHGHLI